VNIDIPRTSSLRRPRATLGLLCALALPPAFAHAAETRLPTDQERASFQAYYQQQSTIGVAPPVYKVTRDSAGAPWRIEVLVDASPRRALRALCRMDRLVFIHDGQWRRDPARQFAWHAPAGCRAIATPIALGQRMPDTDLLALIEQQGALLNRARLLFSGNTACATQRAYNYRLTAIDVTVFINGSEEMATLTYQSDRGFVARVWARRTGLAYDPWNVSCP
jgi:hypothetical protein